MRLPDTGADVMADGRRIPPSAQRNAPALLAELQRHNLRGNLLEIASGSGLHAAHIAPHFPDLIWQTSDLDPDNMGSIHAWTVGIANIRTALILDATRTGWHHDHPALDAILIVNLLHLIPMQAAEILLQEVTLALTGTAFIYGPFLRGGKTTSQGDAAFDASLRAQDPSLGYKDLDWVLARLAPLKTHVTQMPANNLLITAKA